MNAGESFDFDAFLDLGDDPTSYAFKDTTTDHLTDHLHDATSHDFHHTSAKESKDGLFADHEPVINVVAPADDEFVAAGQYADEDFPIYNSNGVPLAETPTFSLTTSFHDNDMIEASHSLSRTSSSATPVSSHHSPSMPTSPAQSLYGVPGSPALASSTAGSPIPFPNAVDSPYLSGAPADAYTMVDDNFVDLNSTSTTSQLDLEELFGLVGNSTRQAKPQLPSQLSLNVPRTSARFRASSDPWDGTGINPVSSFEAPAPRSPYFTNGQERTPSPSTDSLRLAYDEMARSQDVYGGAKAEDYPSPYHGSPNYLQSPSSGSHSPQLSRSASRERNTEARSPYARSPVEAGFLAVPPLARPRSHSASELSHRKQKPSVLFACELCAKRFTRAYNLRSHMRTHMDERPFSCRFCGKSFARQHDRKRHEELHSGEKRFICYGEPSSDEGFVKWGCRRRFARADALGRHFRTEAGKVCLKPLIALIKANGDKASTAPEGIIFRGIQDSVPQLTLIGGDPADQSRRTVLLTAVSEQLVKDDE